MNTIIGPIYPKTHAIAERFCGVTKIPLISPFMHYERTTKDTFPHINLVPSDSISTFGLGQGMARLYPEYTLIVVSDGSSDHYKDRKLFKEGFQMVSKKPIIQIPQHDLTKLYALSGKKNVIVYATYRFLTCLKENGQFSGCWRYKIGFG